MEFAEVDLRDGRLSSTGHAIGTLPSPYLLEYRLETDNHLVTVRLQATTTGDGWRQNLLLGRDSAGRWSASDDLKGEPPFDIGAHELAGLADALDCDLGLSPLTNTMPVLRRGLLHRAGTEELVVAWVSVPDLAVHPEHQRYTSEPQTHPSVVRFGSLDDSFAADIVFDHDGLVLDYPGVARRL